MPNLVGREIGLDHAPVWSELLNGVVHVRRHQTCQFFRPNRFVSGVPVVAGAALADATQFDDNVGALGHGGQVVSPNGQDFFVAVGVGAGAQHPADVVQDDGQIGYGLGELHQLRQLVEVHPGIE